MSPKQSCLLWALLCSAAACADDQTVPFARIDPDAAQADAGSDAGADPDAAGEEHGVPDVGADAVEPPDAGPADTTPADAASDGDGRDADTAPDDSGPDGLLDADPDAGGDSDADPDADPGEVVRFVTFGDWGASITSINRAAEAIWTHCQEAGCDFVIGLGDNFYDDGVTDVDDPQWEDKFEEPFADWDIPFYMTLGNHDYRGDPDAQVAYTELSDRWTMPARFYDLVAGPVHFFAIDTNAGRDAQRVWLDAAIPAAESPWIIAFGHHPWRSHGVYGDDLGSRRAFFEWAFCHRIDFLLNGHEHDLQHLSADCGVEFVISGAMAYTRDTGSGPNTLFSSSALGFVWLEIDAERAVVEFHDFEGNLLHRSVRDRADRTPVCQADAYCAAGCAADPDCSGLDCQADGACEVRCPDDPDCYRDCPCDFNYGLCEPIANPSDERCGCDPECRGDGRPCAEDDHCDTWCPEGIDPDCG